MHWACVVEAQANFSMESPIRVLAVLIAVVLGWVGLEETAVKYDGHVKFVEQTRVVADRESATRARAEGPAAA